MSSPTIDDIFDSNSVFYNGAIQLAIPAGASNAFTDSVNPQVIGDSQSGNNLANVGLDTPLITVAPTDSIQDALVKLNQVGGGRISLLAGTYTIKTALTGYSSISIEGVSPSATILDFASTAANLSFSGTRIYTTGTITSIAGGVAVTGSGTLWLANVTGGQYLFLGTRHYLIAAVTSDTTLILAEAYSDNVSLPGATYRITAAIVDVTLNNFGVRNSTGTAIAFTDALQLTINNVVSILNNVGISFTHVSRNNFQRGVIAGNTSDGIQATNMGQCDWRSIISNGNGGNNITFSNIKNGNFSPIGADAATGDGINITTGVDITFNGGDFLSNGGQGVELVSGCNNVNFIGVSVRSNTSDGIKLTASSDNCHFVSCDFETNGGYGVNIADATCDANIITTNDFASNATAAANDSGTGTIIRGNSGLADNSTGTTSQFSVLGLGGDGSDGTAAFDGSATPSGSSKSGSDYSLTRDVFYTDMTVSTGCTVNPSGYRLFGTGTLTLNGTAIIKRNGNDGGNGGNASGHVAGAGGVALADGYLKGSVVGGTGGVANRTSPTAASAGTNTSNSLGSNAVASGNGGTGDNAGSGNQSGGTAGAAGTITASLTKPKTAWQLNLLLDVTATGATIKFDNSASSGGGGFGGRGLSLGIDGGDGGGGGSSGGIIAIYFKTITLGASASITANGGKGGNGGNGADNGANDRGGGGGGGGGGNGGQIILVYATLSNAGSIVATGGTKGTGGTAGGVGSNTGSNGTDGAAGNVRQFSI